MSGVECSGPARHELTRDQRDFFDFMHLGATGTHRTLGESWARPVRHNRKIERSALWYALLVVEKCTQADEPHQLYLDDRTKLATVAQYELRAAVRTIPRLVPYGVLNHRALQGVGFDYEFQSEQIVRDQPELVEEWHQWLWQPGEARAEPSRRALLLAEGCQRLGESLGVLLDLPVRE